MLSLLTFQNHKHCTSLHLFRSSHFFHQDFTILTTSSVCFLRLTLKYFTLFQLIINSIVILILKSMYSLLIYKNLIDFCRFILYAVILLNSFISSRFFHIYLVIFYTDNCVVYRDHLFLHNLLPFIYFYCSIIQAKTFSIVL